MKTTRVFELNLDAYMDGVKFIINQGGARSGKTFSILQILYIVAKYSKKPLLISVVSQTLPHLKRGAMRDFENIVSAIGDYRPDAWNKTDKTYRVGRSSIEFFSVDNPGKAYGAARDLLFLNEVNNIDEEITRQLVIRTRGTVFMDFNPRSEFYVHSDYMTRKNARLIKSTYLDNKYLDESVRQELIDAGERNENFKRVFLLGEIGVAEDVVFNNWEFGAFDDSLQVVFGQDFGYVTDPTTLIKVAVNQKAKTIYIDECFYRKGLSTKEIAELDRHYAGNGLIVGDCSEPRLIDELRMAGLNIRAYDGYRKIATGLMAMQDYKLIITPNSSNVAKELTMYRWVDYNARLTVDGFDHAIDAMRYAFYYATTGKKQVLVTRLTNKY